MNTVIAGVKIVKPIETLDAEGRQDDGLANQQTAVVVAPDLHHTVTILRRIEVLKF
jgi:hypothetical protein